VALFVVFLFCVYCFCTVFVLALGSYMQNVFTDLVQELWGGVGRLVGRAWADGPGRLAWVGWLRFPTRLFDLVGIARIKITVCWFGFVSF
jgi:hypothetical protein